MENLLRIAQSEKAWQRSAWIESASCRTCHDAIAQSYPSRFRPNTFTRDNGAHHSRLFLAPHHPQNPNS
jgi:hypothetical protein